jgi:hypothetical protein
VTVFVAIDPSSAVTVTVTVLLPATKELAPETATVAAAEVAVATTATELVPGRTVRVEPLVTAVPAIVRVERVFTLLSVFTVTVTV